MTSKERERMRERAEQQARRRHARQFPSSEDYQDFTGTPGISALRDVLAGMQPQVETAERRLDEWEEKRETQRTLYVFLKDVRNGVSDEQARQGIEDLMERTVKVAGERALEKVFYWQARRDLLDQEADAVVARLRQLEQAEG